MPLRVVNGLDYHCVTACGVPKTWDSRMQRGAGEGVSTVHSMPHDFACMVGAWRIHHYLSQSVPCRLQSWRKLWFSLSTHCSPFHNIHHELPQFNVAEAVNFALPEWIPHGRESIEHYKRRGRWSVLCHEQLILSIAKECNDLATCVLCEEEMRKIIQAEENDTLQLAAQGKALPPIARTGWCCSPPSARNYKQI